MINSSPKSRDLSEKKRNIISVIKEVNLAFANIHKKLHKQIDFQKYEHATNYVNRYVSYTDVWNLKFNYNIESAEVAVLQYLHLNYIFMHEHDDLLPEERKLVVEMFELFSLYKPFSNAQIEERKQKMYSFIEEQKKDSQ